ncbi:OmpA family protein [Rhizosaccharibacter radicis]|uniref:OmpA family protein n=1 Tax=Rhizosaccharibacter radicis TaxID=2782605 RepID=A0ABT1VT69_9PROT|nr:OmpA family protein [Acetobacteraceae bacterium KSS12]
MIRPHRLAIAGLPLFLVAACAHPAPGPNPQAETAQAPKNVPLATHPDAAQEVGAVASNRIAVTFPRGGTILTPEADKQLDLAARLFRDANPVLMFTTGYADVSGSEYANLLLSARRAEAVKKALVARGIPADRLLIRAYGVSDPANTDDPRAAENRRVTITWRLL